MFNSMGGKKPVFSLCSPLSGGREGERERNGERALPRRQTAGQEVERGRADAAQTAARRQEQPRGDLRSQ